MSATHTLSIRKAKPREKVANTTAAMRLMYYRGYVTVNLSTYLDDKGVDYHFCRNDEKRKRQFPQLKESGSVGVEMFDLPKRMYHEVVYPGLSHLCNIMALPMNLLHLRDDVEPHVLTELIFNFPINRDMLKNLSTADYKKLISKGLPYEWM